MAGGTIVGLDVGSQLMKVIELRRSGSGVEVTALELAPTPQEAIDNGQIIDAQLLGKAIKELLGRAHVSARKCVSSLSGQSGVVVRVLEVPQISGAELAQHMQFEAERQVPFSLTESIMDFQAVQRPEGYAEGQNMDVLLAVAQMDVVDKHVASLFEAGLKPDSIDVEPLALGRALLDLGQTSDAPGYTVAIVNIGASNTDIGIFRDRLLAFPRTVPLAGDHLTRAISDYMQVDLATAEEYKREYGEVIFSQMQAPPTFTGAETGGGFVDFGAQTAGASGNMPFDFGGAGGAPSFQTEEQSPFAIPGADTGVSPFDFTTQSTAEHLPLSTAEQAGLTGTAETGYGTAETGLNTAEQSFMTAEVMNPTVTAPPTGDLPMPTGSGDPARDALRVQVFNCIAPVLSELVQEIRRSLDYYHSRAVDHPVSEILLTGGSAKLRNLAPFLEQELGIATRVANPLQGVSVSSKNYSPEHLEEIASLFAISLGLGARDLISTGGKKRR